MAPKKPRITRTYAQLHADAREFAGPGFGVDLHLGPELHFPENRNVAYCLRQGPPGNTDRIAIYVRKKLLSGPQARMDAILRHELSHAIEFYLGEKELRRRSPIALPSGPERRADALAELLWEDPIYYDRELIQTTSGGRRPRPAFLGP